MLSTTETPFCETIKGSTAPSTISRVRNAVYWTGHGPLARLISEALDDAVTHMEEANGQAFPRRLAPLKRGRPRTKVCPAPLPLPSAVADSVQ